MTVRLERRLAQLQRAAAAGDVGAANRAEALAVYMGRQATAADKRGDDRVKVLVGAWAASELAAHRSVTLDDPQALLRALDGWLIRPGDRLAVLGKDRKGSHAFHRVIGLDSVTESAILIQ